MITERDVSLALKKAGCGIVRRQVLTVPTALPVFQPASEPTLHALLTTVAYVVGLPIDVIKSHRRDRDLARARAIFYWTARRLTSKSLNQIARFCGDRHHTTVMAGLDCVDANRAFYEPDLTTVIQAAFNVTGAGK